MCEHTCACGVLARMALRAISASQHILIPVFVAWAWAFSSYQSLLSCSRRECSDLAILFLRISIWRVIMTWRSTIWRASLRVRNLDVWGFEFSSRIAWHVGSVAVMRSTMSCHCASDSFSDFCQTFIVMSARCRAFLHSQGVPRLLRGIVLIMLSTTLRISVRYLDLSGSGVQPPAITCLGSGEAMQPATQLRLYSRMEG